MFFPEFMKVDALNDFKVIDLGIGQHTMHALCKHKQTGQTHLFGWGFNQYGQLISQDFKQAEYSPIELTPVFNTHSMIEAESTLISICTGAFHSLFLSSSNSLYGLGSNKYSQLTDDAANPTSSLHSIDLPITEDQEIRKVEAGSFYSIALVGKRK